MTNRSRIVTTVVITAFWICPFLTVCDRSVAAQTLPPPKTKSVTRPLGVPPPVKNAPVKNDKKPQDTQDSAEKQKIADMVKITIVSSRGTVSHDGSYGVSADVQNISPDPLILNASEMVLVVQPEVSHPKPCVDWATAIFPTQRPAIDTQATNAQIRILPNEHYAVFWDLSPRPPQKNGMCQQNGRLSDLLGFVPGDYAFTVEGIAHSSTENETKGTPHTFTETTILKVGLSLAYTAIAAFCGGLLAYFVVFLQPGQDFDKWRPTGTTSGKAKVLLVWTRNGLAAGLLAASVTIIASRLSDTQFPVKVSVNDVWGALTIGFVAYFVGSKFIKSLANKLTDTVPPPQAPAAPLEPTVPPAVPGPEMLGSLENARAHEG